VKHQSVRRLPAVRRVIAGLMAGLALGLSPIGTTTSPVGAVPGAPTIGSVTAFNSAAAVVSWSPPSDTSNLVGYQVVPRADGADLPPISVPATATSLTVTGLTNGTSYTFVVRSVYSTGTFASAPSNSVTPFGLPGAAGNIVLTPGNNELQVSWVSAAANGSPISSYVVTLSPADSPAKTVNGTTTSTTFTGLTNGKSYSVTISATNQRGTTTSSQSSSVRPVGPPSAPIDIDATAGDTTATVSWAPPADTGGPEISSYTVVITTGSVSTNITISDPNQRTYTAQGLTNGLAYAFAVSATNEAGLTSPISASDSATPAPAATPVINSSGLSPLGGPIAGGFNIEIVGSNLALVSQVSFMCSDATRAGVIIGNPTQNKVVVQAPQCPAGSTQLSVSGAGLTSNAVSFNFRAPPTIQSVAPSSGPRSGGYDITISGANFVPGRTAVRIGNRASVISSISATSISVSIPGLDPGEAVGARSIAVVVDASIGLTALSAGGFTYTENPAPGGGGGASSTLPGSQRLSGATRFDTSSLVSSKFFSPGVNVVFVATGRSFADALAAGPAAQGRGPMLITEPNEIPASIRGELRRLQPSSIVVLGGVTAISEKVKNDLRSFTSGEVTRVGGATRYDTAVEVSKARFSPGVRVVYVATGENFADALVAGAASRGQGPVLLTEKSSLPSVTRDEIERLRPERIVLLGGISAVSDAVLSSLHSIGNFPVERLAGPDRYATAALVVSNASFDQRGIAIVATGEQYADALSAAPVGAPVLLARPTCLPSAAHDELRRLNPSQVIVLGGGAALSASVDSYTIC
jgi:putative cell wall-binding protein